MAEIQGFKRRVPPRPSQIAKRQASMSAAPPDQNPSQLSPSPSDSSLNYQSPPRFCQPHHGHLASLGENAPAAFTFNPSLNSNYSSHLPALQPTPARPAIYQTSSSAGSLNDPHGSYPSRPLFPSGSNVPQYPPPPLKHLEERDFTRQVEPSQYIPTFHPTINYISPDGYPQTAPAHATSFAFDPDHRVSQGHIRTRSVQGEPPSATFYSTPTPMDHSGWQGSESIHPDPAMNGTGAVPTYNHSDPATWVRRGFNDIHTGQPIASPDFKTFPLSLAQTYAPVMLSPDPPSTAFDHPLTASTANGDAIGQEQPPPSFKPYAPTTPRAMPIRSDRRTSISSGPYSPRQKTSDALSFSGVISFGREGSVSGGRGSAAEEMAHVRASVERRRIGSSDRARAVEELQKQLSRARTCGGPGPPLDSAMSSPPR